MMDSRDEAHSPSQSEEKFDSLMKTTHNFLEYYEKWTWEGNEPTVKSAFKSAQHCESLYLELAQSNCLLHFDIYLSHWLPRRYPDTKSKKYDVSFFRNSCDSLLGKFLRSEKKISNEIVRQAVLSYISLCSEERLSILLEKLMTESHMFKLVCGIKDSVNSRSKAEKYHVCNDVLLRQLSQLADQNQVDAFKQLVIKSLICGTIYSYLLSYFEKKVPMRIETETNGLLIKTLLDILQENADLRMKFWKVNSLPELDLFGRLATNYPNFLSAMIDFVLEAGHALKMSFDDKFQLTWTASDSSLTYNELVALIKYLINSQGIAGRKLKSFLLNNASSDKDDTSIWSHVVYLLKIQN